MTAAPITATALSSVPSSQAGIASGFNSTVSRLGSLVSVALIGLVISDVYSAEAPGSTLHPLAQRPTTALEYSSSVDAFRAGMLVAAALAFAGAVVAVTSVSDTRAKASTGGARTPMAETRRLASQEADE